MSKQPLLPSGNELPDSYDERLRYSIERELQSLKSKIRLLYEGRVSSRYTATAAPTGGQWIAGDRLWNSAPSEAGAGGSKYVIVGWICTVTGTPGTWLEMRTLTGN